jgi:hypothetical protein
MLENIRLARTFVAEISFTDFQADQRTSYAVIRCLEIIPRRQEDCRPKSKHAIPRFHGQASLEREASTATNTIAFETISYGILFSVTWSHCVLPSKENSKD